MQSTSLDEIKNNLSDEKKKRVKKEATRLKKLFRDITDEGAQTFLQATIAEVAFLSVLLEDLRADMLINGVCEEFTTATGIKQKRISAATNIYNQCVKNYSTLMRNLEKFVPKPDGTGGAQDKLAEFLMGTE